MECDDVVRQFGQWWGGCHEGRAYEILEVWPMGKIADGAPWQVGWIPPSRGGAALTRYSRP